MDCRFHTKSVRGMLAIVGLLAMCLISGCYERTSEGNQSIYHFAWWLGPAIIGGGILAIPIGWWLREWSQRWGLGLMVMAPILLVIAAPSMVSDRVVIDDEHFEARYGFWFAPTEHNVRFQDLREIQYVAIPGSKGRTNYELRCISSRGETSVVHAGDLVRNTVPEILARAKARGIRVVNQVL